MQGQSGMHSKGVIIPEVAAEDPPPIYGKNYPTYHITNSFAQYPSVFLLLSTLLMMILALIGFTTTDIEFNRGTRDFQVRLHTAYKMKSSVQNLMNARQEYDQELLLNESLSAGNLRSFPELRWKPFRRYYVQYRIDPEKVKAFIDQVNASGGSVAESGWDERFFPPINLKFPRAELEANMSNLLIEPHLQFIRHLELSLTRNPPSEDAGRYSKVCWQFPHYSTFSMLQRSSTMDQFCTPPTSLLGYFNPFPITGTPNGQQWGFWDLALPPLDSIDRVLALFFANPRHKWFLDRSATPTTQATSLLRSQFMVGITEKDQQTLDAGGEIDMTAHDKYMDAFRRGASRHRMHPYIEVTFNGDGIEEYRISLALKKDVWRIVPALFIIWVCLWWYFHSFVLSFLAVLQMGIVFPAVLPLFTAFVGQKTLPFLAVIAYYAIIIMSLTQMMIFFDAFRISGFMATTGRKNTLTMAQRVAYCMRKAGIGNTVAFFVVLFVFAANTTTPFVAIEAFSKLVLLLLFLNWLLMTFMFPNSVLFHHYYFSKRRRNAQRQKEILLERGWRRRAAACACYFKELDELHQRHGIIGYSDLIRQTEEASNREYLQREAHLSVLGRLGLTSAPIGEPNQTPSRAHSYSVARFNPAVVKFSSPDRIDERTESPVEAPPGDSTKIAASTFVNEHHGIDLRKVIQIRNFNCDEMLGFNDTALRHKLAQTNHTAASDFSDAELDALAPELGLLPASTAVNIPPPRLVTLARISILLIFGTARVLRTEFANRISKEAPRAETNEAENSGDSPPAPPVSPPMPAAGTFTQRVAHWWAGRGVQRKWCCGLLGERVNETQEAREARILAKRVKHEGFTKVELFFYNYYAPGLHYARYPVLGVAAVIFAMTIFLTVQLQATSATPTMDEGDYGVDRFLAVEALFAQQGTCDYCGPFFQPRSAFPKPNQTIFTTCQERSLFTFIDECGECNGNNDCLDCAGIPNGTAKVDDCSQCLEPDDLRWNQCEYCEPTSESLECTSCFLLGKFGLYPRADPGWNGPNCSIFCHPEVNCLPEHGKCNRVTGLCDCHADFERGFWTNDPSVSGGAFVDSNGTLIFDNTTAPKDRIFCTICKPGFSGPSCKVECDAEHVVPGSACACVNGACTGCPGGWLGDTCQTPWKSYCYTELGIESDVSMGVCTCLYDGLKWEVDCSQAEPCSNHGVYYDSSTTQLTLFGEGYLKDFVSPGISGCVCVGHWVGPKCGYCRCFNGGKCLPNGTCQCDGSWYGPDCSQCAPTCRNHGKCHLPWPPSMYPQRVCRGLFCSSYELGIKEATTERCEMCNSPPSPCWNFSDDVCQNSTVAPNCKWDSWTGRCERRVSPPTEIPPEYMVCTCKGAWSGVHCETCNSPHKDVTCRDDGVLVGCDGLPADRGQYKVYDLCGQCGGSDQCIGCDGIVGSSKVFDQCGVCGGYNECPAGGNTEIVAPAATVTFTWGIDEEKRYLKLDVDEDTELQMFLLHTCRAVMELVHLIRPEKSRCIWEDFVAYLGRVGMPFPYPPNTTGAPLHEHLVYFVLREGRGDEVVFGADKKPILITAIFQTIDVPDRGTSHELRKPYDDWTALVKILNAQFGDREPKIRMVSDPWVEYIAQEAVMISTRFTLFLVVLAFVLIMLPATCSLILTAMATVCLIAACTTVTAIFYLIGWDLGIIELVALSFLPGMCAEQITHQCEGYLEFIQATQSHIFARTTTTLQGVRGMLERTGISLFGSGLILILCCLLPAIWAELAAFRRIGVIVMLIVCSSMFYSTVVFPTLLSAAGPVTNARNWKLIGVMLCVGFVFCGILFCILYFSGVVTTFDQAQSSI